MSSLRGTISKMITLIFKTFCNIVSIAIGVIMSETLFSSTNCFKELIVNIFLPSINSVYLLSVSTPSKSICPFNASHTA